MTFQADGYDEAGPRSLKRKALKKVTQTDGSDVYMPYSASYDSVAGSSNAITITNDSATAPAIGYTAESAYTDVTGAASRGLVGLAKGLYIKVAAIASSVAGTLTTSNATIGLTTDAAIVTNANGTAIGFLRGLVKFVYERMPASLGQKTKAESLPIVIASDQDAIAVSGTIVVGTTPTTGTHGNAWSAVAVGAGEASAAVDTRYTPFVTVTGNSSAATTITLQISQNNSDYYETSFNQILVGAGNFYYNATIGARYCQLKSSGAATITATIAAKG